MTIHQSEQRTADRHRSRGVFFWPLVVTVVGIAWTAAVSPHTGYGADWAIDPIVGLFVLSIGIHIWLVIRFRPKWYFATYAVVHTAMQALVFLVCLMAISKDSL